jgi:hypothetical protein
MSAFQGIAAGGRTLFSGLLMNQHQAKNLMDAVWINIQNTAVNALAGILEQAIINELVSSSMMAATTIAETASMATIAAAAAPAAWLVSIASFGAADWAGASSFISSLAMMKTATVAMAFEQGGRVRKGEVGFFEGRGAEIVAPEEDFKQIMRAEMIPLIRMDLARQQPATASIGTGELVSEIKEMHATLKKLHLEAVWEGKTLKAVLTAQDKFDKRAGRK